MTPERALSPAPTKRKLRTSAQLYKALPHYERLAEAVKTLLGRDETHPTARQEITGGCYP